MVVVVEVLLVKQERLKNKTTQATTKASNLIVVAHGCNSDNDREEGCVQTRKTKKEGEKINEKYARATAI